MKKIFLSLTAILLCISCSDEDFDINRDPDNLSAGGVALSTELPAGIVGLVGAQGSYYALIGGFWSQFWTQSFASNQYKDIDNYSIGTVDYNAGWTAMYDALGDIRNVKRNAESQENWRYYLIATTLEVQASHIMVDFYDQIPYTEANSATILQPQFNTGQEVYDLMVADLQLALSKDLSASIGETPANDDFIFGGDMAKWTAYANTLLLKIYMRQTEARPAIAQAGIATLLTSGVAFLDVDAAMTQFVNEPNRSNPLFESDRRQLNTTLNLRASTTMYSFLDSNNDPRLDDFYTEGISENQGDFGNLGDPAEVAVVILKPITPVYLMSREESLFLQAEALERYAGGTGAKEKYDAAVVAAFGHYNADDGDPEDGSIDDGPVLNGAPFVAPGGAYEYPLAGTFEDKLKAIITQKWIASFPGNGFESFFEQNRTGYPEMSDVPQTDASYVPGELAYSLAGTTGGVFPRRVVFPSNVTSTNVNAPDLVELTVPVWWDVN